jgi:hypothetical protein
MSGLVMGSGGITPRRNTQRPADSSGVFKIQYLGRGNGFNFELQHSRPVAGIDATTHQLIRIGMVCALLVRSRRRDAGRL